jgi:hypothetical protein
MPSFFTFSLCSLLSVASFLNVVVFTRLTVSSDAAPAAEVHFWLLFRTLECGNDKFLRHYENFHFHCTNGAADAIFHQLHRK